MKYLITLFLISCTTSGTVEKRMGEGASCVAGYDNTFLCTKFGKSYICYPENGGGRIFCFEATNAEDL